MCAKVCANAYAKVCTNICANVNANACINVCANACVNVCVCTQMHYKKEITNYKMFSSMPLYLYPFILFELKGGSLRKMKELKEFYQH